MFGAPGADSIKQTVQSTFVYELVFIGLAYAFYWPFTLWFKTAYNSLDLWSGARTPLFDYLFVFGLPIFLMISLLIRDLFPALKAGYQQWVFASKQRFASVFNWRHVRLYLVILMVIIGLGVLWRLDYQVLTFGIPLLVGIAYLLVVGRSHANASTDHFDLVWTRSFHYFIC